MRLSDGTLSPAEHAVMQVVRAAGPRGAALAGATRPALGQVDSTIARRLEHHGVLRIEHATAYLPTEDP